jgi:hypothetical protein
MGPSPRQTTKEELAEHFEYNESGSVELENNRVQLTQELSGYDRTEDERYEGIKVNGEVIVMKCHNCTSTFKYLREITLVEADVPLSRIKEELSEDLLDDLGYEVPYTPSWQDNSGCNHNYVHQSFEGNGVKVRCTKCQATKVI